MPCFLSLSNGLLDIISQTEYRTHFSGENVVIVSPLRFLRWFMCYETYVLFGVG